jgi:hypothetical protein
MNEPLPSDPDDFCFDCALDAEEILAALSERGSTQAPGSPTSPRSVSAATLELPVAAAFLCDPCACGGHPDCERCA